MRYLIILAALVAAVFGAIWFAGFGDEQSCLDAGGQYVDGQCAY